MKLTIYTDGASRGNPGLASYGFSITDSEGKVLYEEGRYIGRATNNFAEYSGLLNALKYVQENLPNVAEINCYMDSKLVVEQLSGRFKIKSPNLRGFISEIKELEKSLPKITYQHVPRKLNSRADTLANQALDSL